MMDKHNVSYHSMVAMPPIMTLALWLLTGFPDTAEQTMGTYYVQLVMTVITLAAVPIVCSAVSGKPVNSHSARVIIGGIATILW